VLTPAFANIRWTPLECNQAISHEGEDINPKLHPTGF